MNFKHSFIIAAFLGICFSNLAFSNLVSSQEQESQPNIQTAQPSAPSSGPATIQTAPEQTRTQRVSSVQYSLGIKIIGIDSKTGGNAHRITTIKQDSPAAIAGLLPNDIILSINNIRTGEMRTFRDLVQNSRGNVNLVVERDGKRMSISVRPDQWGADIVERIIQLPKKTTYDPAEKIQSETNFRINNIADLNTLKGPAYKNDLDNFLKYLRKLAPENPVLQTKGSGTKKNVRKTPAAADGERKTKTNPDRLTSKKIDRDKRMTKPSSPLLVQDGKLLDRVTIVYHAELGQLSIRGRAEDVKIVEDAINSFMRLTSAPGQPQEVIRLFNISPARAATAISEVYDQRFASHLGEATITPRVQPPALVVVGRPKAIEAIRGLIAAFDATQF